MTKFTISLRSYIAKWPSYITIAFFTSSKLASTPIMAFSNAPTLTTSFGLTSMMMLFEILFLL